jgi:N-acetylglucosamine kinase-like BadF-type ATPase
MYSENVLKIMSELKEKKAVISKTYVSSTHNKEIFTLTPEGRRKAKEILEQIDKNVKKTLLYLCKGAKQLGYSGILRYTYTKYPQFTSQSEITENVFSSYDLKEG